MKINLTQKIVTTLLALIISSASLSATDYTTTVTTTSAGNTVTLQNGDTINTDGVRSIQSTNGGTVTVQNPSTDSIIVTTAGAVHSVYSNASTVNLGTGSKIYATEFGAANILAGSTLIADNLTVEAGSATHFIDNAHTFTVTDSSINLGSNSSVTAYLSGLRTVMNINNTTFTTTDNFTLKGYGSDDTAGLLMSNSIVNLGTNANIEAGRATVVNNTSLTAENATFRGTGTTYGYAMTVQRDSIVNLTNSNLIADTDAIRVGTTASGGGTSEVNIIGGTVQAENRVVAQLAANASVYASGAVINFMDGAKANSKAGVLFDNSGIDPIHEANPAFASIVEINISGSTTEVAGRITDVRDSSTTTLKVSDSAKWTSTGASNVDNLILDNANLEFNMTSINDSIVTGNLTLEGSSNALIGFTNDFLEEVLASGLMDNLDASIVTSFLDGDGDITYTFATSNDEGSTWDIVDYGDGTFDISNINIIPEPSTYALILGVLTLGLAIYRRRK